MSNLGCTYRLAPSARFAAQNEIGVLLDTKRGKCYSLNAVATFICLNLKMGCSHATLLNALQQCFQVSDQDLDRNLKQFLAELHRRELWTRTRRNTPLLLC
jgi:hypothetical protein